MTPLADWPKDARRKVRAVLTDIDDTLTHDGRLPAASYAALERLQAAGFIVVPVTGRPAGWCDLIARFWPVDAVVGENGALYFRYDRAARRMDRRLWLDEARFAADRARRDALAARVLAEVPGTRLASDQPYRLADLAIDFAEDTGPLNEAAVQRIVALCEQAGATAKVSSIHVNAWFGDWDKLGMARLLFADVFGLDVDRDNAAVAYVGDSPNDQPMFAHFANSIGVANVARFRLDQPPAYVARGEGGAGFVEVAQALLAAR